MLHCWDNDRRECVKTDAISTLHARCVQIVRSGTPVLRRSYKATKDVRHYYEDIALPGNFAVIGDAVAKFNP